MVMGSNPGHLLKYIFHFSLVIYVALDIASYFTNKNSAQIHTLSALIKKNRMDDHRNLQESYFYRLIIMKSS